MRILESNCIIFQVCTSFIKHLLALTVYQASRDMQRKAELHPVREIFLRMDSPIHLKVFCKRNKVSLKRSYIDTSELEELMILKTLEMMASTTSKPSASASDVNWLTLGPVLGLLLTRSGESVIGRHTKTR